MGGFPETICDIAKVVKKEVVPVPETVSYNGVSGSYAPSIIITKCAVFQKTF